MSVVQSLWTKKNLTEALQHLMILQRIHKSCKREFSLPPWQHGLEFMPWNTQHEGSMVTILQPVCITNWFLVHTRICVTQKASEMFVNQTYILNTYLKKIKTHACSPLQLEGSGWAGHETETYFLLLPEEAEAIIPISSGRKDCILE